MEGTQTEVLYEIRRHAGRSLLPFDPSHVQTNEGATGGSFLSYLSLEGVSKIKEKWNGYYKGKEPKRQISFFASPNGEYVAVSACYEIVFLHQKDNYTEPCGIYTNNDRTSVFTKGAWLEPEGIIVIFDDSGTLFLIKSNGEEIARRSSKQLKLSSPVSGLILQDRNSSTSLCQLTVFTRDSSVQYFDINVERGSIGLYTVPDSANHLALAKTGQLPLHIYCLDFDRNLSLIALIGGSIVSSSSTGDTGTYSLYLFHTTKNSELNFTLRGPEFKGSFSSFPPPKALISPQAKYIAALDSVGSVNIFKLDANSNSLSHCSFTDQYLTDTLDFAWWREDTLVLAKKGGSVIFYNIMSNKKVSGKEPSISTPIIIEGIKYKPGFVFILEYEKLGGNSNTWSLESLSEVSIPEMYTVLLNEKNYQSALEFATRYGLGTDEVYRAQWLDSDKGIFEIENCLSRIADWEFVLSECMNRVGPTEPVVRALISFGLGITAGYTFGDTDRSEEDSVAWEMRVFRLQLLQCRDRLETFVGINMGRFSEEEYRKFRSVSLVQTAISLSENGKIGALNLLFKRHPYTISPQIFSILSSIPETVPVQSYSQLLPTNSPPNIFILRDPDWVECEKTVSFIEKSPNFSGYSEKIVTEIILKCTKGIAWPSVREISDWYSNRAREMDSLSGQLENSISLLDFACQKGITGLDLFLYETKYLYDIIYSDESVDFTMGLGMWEKLSGYEKFRFVLKGVKEENLVQKLREKAVPFMEKKREERELEKDLERGVSYVVKWLKEIARENRLSICSGVFENWCGDLQIKGLFKGIQEVVDTAIECIYLCSATDKWGIMGSILSIILDRVKREKLSSESNILERLEKRVKVTQGHVEVGRLLAYYQVPKPIAFFLGAESEEKNVKQLIRLILSKFGRRQPGRPDTDWAAMWRDLISCQEKAFSFLNLEYLLTEFVRGLLKAGKFSLARNYLRGTSSVSLSTEKAESLVVQSAREYFFSASTLSCSEIWKAKECLSLLPNSKIVQSESNMIDALTLRLPALGVTLLPMQFKQIRDPMEIINTILTTQSGAYLNVDEITEIAQLLGLKSEDEICSVEEAIARSALVAGDVQLSSELCLRLVQKNHGQAWDLCASLSCGPHIDFLDLNSRRKLLGFSLRHCDEDSLGELFNTWKDLDLRVGLDRIRVRVSGPTHPNECVKMIRELVNEENGNLESILGGNRKFSSFVESELPWLAELCEQEDEEELEGKNVNLPREPSRRNYFSRRTLAISSILSCLAQNNLSPKDELVLSLAESVMRGPHVSEERDLLSCLFLLNLSNPLGGVGVIEDEIRRRESYGEINSMMNAGMLYSSVNSARKGCTDPDARRELLLQRFHQRVSSLDSEGTDQATFWREWKAKLEEEKRLAEQARVLERIIPGIETSKFLSGDKDYIKNSVFSFIDSAKTEKKNVLKEAVQLADTYGLDRSKVLLHFFGCALISDCWENEDILSEISEYRDEIVKNALGVIFMISESVYPQISGQNKIRLSYIYSILSACHSFLTRSADPAYIKCLDRDHQHLHSLEPFQFYKTLEQECLRVSSIENLDFKNISGLHDLNFERFNEELCENIDEGTVDALAGMVRNLVGIYENTLAKGLISKEGVYKQYVLAVLASIEGRSEARPGNCIEFGAFNELIKEIEMGFDRCKNYVKFLPESDVSYVIGRFFSLSIPGNFSREMGESEKVWRESLVLMVGFWIQILGEILGEIGVLICLRIFEGLVTNGKISVEQGWETVCKYIKLGFFDGFIPDFSYFLKSMVFSRCDFESIGEVYYGTIEQDPNNQSSNLFDLYNDSVDSCLSGLINGADPAQDLCNLLSSLSKFGGDHTEDLKLVRSEIWGKLEKFSENMQLESQIRVYALQLMQTVTGENTKTLPTEIASCAEKWESWEGTCMQNYNFAHRESENSNFSTSAIASTLVALKSTQLVSSISPDFTISPDDLKTLDSAISCFLHLSETLDFSVEGRIDILRAILEEWEQLLCANSEQSGPHESPKESNSNDWSNNEWDEEGWESFPEDSGIGNNMKTESEMVSVTIHPLHTCWMEIVRKFIELGEMNRVMELLDRSTSKSRVLLDEDETNCLIEILGSKDCFICSKVLMLLPYRGPLCQCIDIIESKLRDESMVFDAFVGGDFEFLLLVLLSGLLNSDLSAYPKFFSFVCYLVGKFARVCQEEMLKQWKGESEIEQKNRNEILIFTRVILPSFVSEMVIKREYLLAGFILSKWMHTHVSLGLIDLVEPSLKRYLDGQILVQIQNQDLNLEFCGSVSCTFDRLRSRLGPLLQSALLALPDDSE